ncbi:MAG: CotH kinase family protein [Candidatus Riflebacteria bacterium]|nr:CotH kinase family protein [Candidatus Riflebacteria bacterium]
MKFSDSLRRLSLPVLLLIVALLIPEMPSDNSSNSRHQIGVSVKKQSGSAESGSRIASMIDNFADENDLFNIREVRLSIDPKDFAFLFSHRPLSISSYQPGLVQTDEHPKPVSVRVRVRGHHYWHWLPEKPSLRLKVSDRHPLWGRNSIDLVNPEDPTMLANIIGDHLALRLGLAASITRFCKLWINDSYYGLYHLTDRLEDTHLPRIGMPASPVVEGNSWKLEMWQNPELWDVHVKDPAIQSRTRKEFSVLLNTILPPVSAENLGRLITLIDPEAFARWSALNVLMGSLHTDDYHNQHFLYDERHKRFIPAINDPSGFGSLTNTGLSFTKKDYEIPLYEYLTPFTNAAFRRYDLQFLRNKRLFEFMNGPCKADYMTKLATRLFAAIRPFSAQDPHRSALINLPHISFPLRLPISLETQASAVSNLKYWIEQRDDFILSCLSSVSVRISPLAGEVASSAICAFVVEVCGHAPIEWDLGAMTNLVILDTDLNKSIDGNDPVASRVLRLYPGLREGSGSSIPWISCKNRLLPFILQPASQTYLIGFPASRTAEFLSALRNGKNSITGGNVSVSIASDSTAPEQLYALTSCLHPWEERRP